MPFINETEAKWRLANSPMDRMIESYRNPSPIVPNVVSPNIQVENREGNKVEGENTER
jgi:hypothetical protein